MSLLYGLGKGWRSEDNRLQTRPQQSLRPEDEDISHILQWNGKAVWYNAFHAEVASLKWVCNVSKWSQL